MALRWDNVDFVKNTISIRHSIYKLKGEQPKLKDPKNKSSIRTVTFPGYCNELLRLLRKDQAENKLKIGSLWQDGNWLFTQWNGEPMNPDTPTGWFPTFLKRHDLPHIKFHALRHTSATLLLFSGNNVKAVSSRLGHAKLETTNRYLHMVTTADAAAADTFETMFNPAVKKEQAE